MALWRRILTIDDDGILRTYLIRKPRRVAWNEVRYSEIAFWIDRIPYQILVFGDSPDKPLLDIPLKLYNQTETKIGKLHDEILSRGAAGGDLGLIEKEVEELTDAIVDLCKKSYLQPSTSKSSARIEDIQDAGVAPLVVHPLDGSYRILTVDNC